MIVCDQKFSVEVIEKIQMTVDSDPEISRRALSRLVCEWLNWKGANGKLKEMSCRIALNKLHKKNVLKLPKPVFKGSFESRKNGTKAIIIPEIKEICCNLKELGNIELIKITSRYANNSKIWKELMNEYHYLSSGPLCGAQIRYLIKSENYGWLGGLAFSAAAWRIKNRDNWIGWDEGARKAHLQKIVSNSRFLILPQVRVLNLASHVLSKCTKQLVQDWIKDYGYEPVLLETFVEQGRFEGTCYKAANWQYIGETSGRGRQDSDRKKVIPVKDIYVYPLHRDFKEILCEKGLNPAAVFETEKIIREEDWVKEEFGEADLGDNRLEKRLLCLGRDLYANPQANIPQACKTRAKTKAAYRFFENKNTTMEKLLQPHYKSTQNRIKKEKVVLSVQDTTSFNYSTHSTTKDLGPIGSKKEGVIGLLMHDTMAFNLDGTPLGLIDIQCWARDADDFGKKNRRHKLPIEEKESYKWLKSFNKTAEMQKNCPETMLVSVGDRESDIYELFILAHNDPKGPKLLVRAEHDRLLAEDQGHLWDKLEMEPVSGIKEVHIPRQKNRPARVAHLEVKFSQVTLKPPERKKNLNELTIWVVLAQEVDAPDNVKPLEWMLLSTLEVATFEDATEKLFWYTLRWGIEVYHRTLKSGVKVEERQLGSADNIKSCLAIDLVVAWRVFHLTKLGRETPDVPCTVFFEEEEWKALTAYVTGNPIPPEEPPILRDAMRMVASLGGFLGRKSDGEPGTKSLWLGLQELSIAFKMWKVINAAPHP